MPRYVVSQGTPRASVSSRISAAKFRRLGKIAVANALRGYAASRRSSSASGAAVYKRGRLTLGPTEGPELKMRDTNIGSTTVGFGSPYINSMLKDIAQGDGLANRDGHMITVKSLDVKFNFEGIGGASVTGREATVFMSWFILLDKQPNTVQATTSDVFTLSNTDLTFGYTPNLRRFQVLRTGMVALNIQSDRCATEQVHVPLDIGVRFPDSTSVPVTNDILIACLSTGPTAAGASFFDGRMSAVCRVKWNDK